MRAPKGFSEEKPEAAKLRGRSPRGFAAEGLLAAQCSHPRNSSEGTISSTLPQRFSTIAQTIKILRFFASSFDLLARKLARAENDY